ncbi:MAG TPA: DUF3140 domain-containing protein [Micromonosporaceae bacterium]
MPIPDRTDPEMNEIWEQFHAYVNVNSGEFRDWLMTRAADGDAGAFSAPHRLMPEPGKSILAVLGKRKVDLTPRDVDVMRSAVNQIQDLLAARPALDGDDGEWRRSLLDLGHDPLRAG